MHLLGAFDETALRASWALLAPTKTRPSQPRQTSLPASTVRWRLFGTTTAHEGLKHSHPRYCGPRHGAKYFVNRLVGDLANELDERSSGARLRMELWGDP